LIALTALPAGAYINQADGIVVPVTTRLQQCLDRAATAETTVGAVNAIVDAAVLPEVYRPVFDAASGHYRVTFIDIGEGAGYRNSFGWFWADTDPTVPANLHTVFGCRTYATCACPCATTRTVTVDFDLEPGFAPGRGIIMWLRTPERLDGTSESGTYDTTLPYCTPSVGCDPNVANLNDSCGGRLDTSNRIYFTSQALNDDGDYVHFLVYESATRVNTYYFGFEDLFRGGDNDFEDMLVRATGLVPLCSPVPETCNNLDDDCDAGIDEGLTTACSTACGPGVRTCVAGTFGACSAPTPAAETCNDNDDDCDTRTDEGLSRSCMNMCGTGTEICRAGAFVDCTAPTPTIESCNNDDDDCDTLVDEGITRACFTTCGSGTETCMAGAFVGCTAPAPGVETCNAMDEDCDGRTDEGLTRACSTACGTGIETCIAGAYVGCTAPAPEIESCNDADDDCDTLIDEGITRTCSTACGVGTERCERGSFVDCDAPLPSAEVCNNIDDNCNGVIDDGDPGGGAACIPTMDGGYMEVPEGGGGEDICMPGRVRCVAGVLRCLGASSASREICNCLDDDCDGNIDEEVGGSLCPGGACVSCMCASPCEDTEFPCPPGRECDRSLADPGMGVIGYCVPGRCAAVMCNDEEICDPDTGTCVNLCDGVSCSGGFTCVRGLCVEDNCYGRGCAVGERCRMGACEPDPCDGVTCGAREFCREGACVAVCEAPCEPGTVCRDGACVPSACASCSELESCVEDACVANTCDVACGRSRICAGEECTDDPCTWIDCPSGTVCRDAQCQNEEAITPPPTPVLGLASGGGGCTCSAAEGSTSGGGSGSLLTLLFFVGFFSVRRRLRLAPVALCGALAVVPASGCSVDPFCFGNCGEDAGATPDAGALPDGSIVDGCVPTGEELCDTLDNDCNGVVDDGFDTMTDPRHCGECNLECILPHAFPACEMGMCAIERCEIGWHDANGAPADGCEYSCPPSGSEICDELDNDCDTRIDEDFDLTMNLGHCGRCGNICTFPNAAAMCVAGTCRMGACNPGFVDANGDPADGCEYACTDLGAEVCNEVDDDCDMNIDETFDLSMDRNNCGSCGTACTFTHAVGVCTMGACGIGSCDPGFWDIDGNPLTGCEYACTPSGMPDTCNSRDDDCDGATDEADTMVGTACGVSTGACDPGVNACSAGSIVCVGGRGGTPETCNSVDDDCDGRTDESTAGSPIPMVGNRCGESNVGRCRYGTLSCTGGALVCGGTYVGPIGETCNGVDDDCDGTADDTPAPPSPTPPSCVETRGVCAGRVPDCRGAAGWACDFPASYQATETICDTLDNDCDGTGDEGCLRARPASDVRVDTGDASGASNSLQPVLESNGTDRAYCSWQDRRGGTTSHILFNRWASSTDTWSSPTQLDTSTGVAMAPQIAVTGAIGDDLAVLWADFRGGTSYREIYSRFSTDSGAGFGASDTRVNPGSTQDSFNIDVAISGANVWVVYEVFVSSRSRQIFVARSNDGGVNWGTPAQASHGTGTSLVAATPRIAVLGSTAIVVWRDNRNGGLDIFANRVMASGVRGVAPDATDIRIDTGTMPGTSSSFSPDVAAEGTNVYVAWVDDRDAGSLDIYFNRSTDGGATFGTATSIDDDPIAHDSIEPRVLALGTGRVGIGWVDYRSGFPDVIFRRSTTGGMTFEDVVRLDTGTAAGTSSSLELAIASRGDLVIAAWTDDRRGFYDIFGNFSLDGGATFQPADVQLNVRPLTSSYDSSEPAVAVTATAGHVVWVDHRGGANGDIFYRRLGP
jgi:hypothetical protein